jgi:hypothetical protein
LAFAPVGLAVWGPLAEAIGVEEALALSGVLSVLSATALVCVRDVRRVRA